MLFSVTVDLREKTRCHVFLQVLIYMTGSWPGRSRSIRWDSGVWREPPQQGNQGVRLEWGEQMWVAKGRRGSPLQTLGNIFFFISLITKLGQFFFCRALCLVSLPGSFPSCLAFWSFSHTHTQQPKSTSILEFPWAGVWWWEFRGEKSALRTSTL